MAYLHKVFRTQQRRQLHLSDVGVTLGQLPKSQQFIAFNVVPVFFGKQILINLKTACLGQHDGAVHVVVQALLENSATQVIRLA
jgi:hypothetical protein